MINKFRKLLHFHRYNTKKWRLIHYNEEPLTIIVGAECEICGKRKLFFGVPRNSEWEEKHKDLFDENLWDSKWEKCK